MLSLLVCPTVITKAASTVLCTTVLYRMANTVVAQNFTILNMKVNHKPHGESIDIGHNFKIVSSKNKNIQYIFKELIDIC